MTENADPVPEYEYDGDGDDRTDLGPGEDVETDLFGEVDPNLDYDDAIETWVGEPARTEFSIHPIDGGAAKRFVFVEPQTPEEMENILQAILHNNHYDFCRVVVEEPALTPTVYEKKLTERERALLFDHAAAWIRLSDFVDMQAVEAGDV